MSGTLPTLPGQRLDAPESDVSAAHGVIRRRGRPPVRPRRRGARRRSAPFFRAGVVQGLLPVVAIVAGCADDSAGRSPGADPIPAAYAIRDAPVGFTEVGNGIEPAGDIEAMIAPYRAQLQDQLAEVLGHAQGGFTKDDPEGTLDNLVADALLEIARELAAGPVHASLVNEGGLRVPIAEGPIRMRHAYELLPFENFVTILTLSGSQMERLADEIAMTDGEPIAGWTMELDEDDAVSVLVAGEPIDPGRNYRLATVDYLVNGGGAWSVLWETGPEAREDLDILIRDVFVRYLRTHGTVTPTLDGRIRAVSEPTRSRPSPGARSAPRTAPPAVRDGHPAHAQREWRGT